MRYKLRYDRSPRLTECADKLAARGYVASRVGSKYLPQVFASGAALQSEWFENLPAEFLVKTNHGCGGIIMITAAAPPDSRLPDGIGENEWSIYAVQPENFDYLRAEAITSQWLAQNFNDISVAGKPFEWAYQGVEAQVFVEEMLQGTDGGPPHDYKFYCFNGKVQMISHVWDRFREMTFEAFDTNWNRLDVEYNGYRFAPLSAPSPRPPQLAEMLEVAEALSAGVDHIRVDLYLTNRGVKVGEITNYSAAGKITFKPEGFAKELGKTWKPNYRGHRAHRPL